MNRTYKLLGFSSFVIFIFTVSNSFLFFPPIEIARAENSENSHFKKITKAPHQTTAPDESAIASEESKLPKDSPVAVKKAVVKSQNAPGTKQPSHAAHHDHEGVPPARSLQFLANGNARYLSKKTRSDGRDDVDRKRLLLGQHPHAIILSCADSRVPPETVFDQSLGEIFTIRVAGEALDSSVIASVEYAVEHLGPKLLVVMGHTKCGAVDTAIKVKAGDSAGSESLDRLLADIRPRLKNVSVDKTSASLEVESKLNAEGVSRDLVSRSDIIRKKVEAGDLVIKPALYYMDSGKVSFQ